MGFESGIQELTLLLLIGAWIFGAKRPNGIGIDSLRSQLQKDLGHMPVYSGETTNGKEAEFIRDRLPKRIPTIVLLVVIVVFGAIAWWLTR